MILEVLIIMVMFLWFLVLGFIPPLTPYHGSSKYLAFIAVLLIVLYMFAPALRG